MIQTASLASSERRFCVASQDTDRNTDPRHSEWEAILPAAWIRTQAKEKGVYENLPGGSNISHNACYCPSVFCLSLPTISVCISMESLHTLHKRQILACRPLLAMWFLRLSSPLCSRTIERQHVAKCARQSRAHSKQAYPQGPCTIILRGPCTIIRLPQAQVQVVQVQLADSW